MKAIEMAMIIDIETNCEYDLGISPTGLIFQDGDVYRYDNTFAISLDENKQYKFIDVDGNEEICRYDELFIGVDLDEYERPE